MHAFYRHVFIILGGRLLYAHSNYVYPLGISVAKGRQFTEGFGRVTDHCCVDVSGEYDCACIRIYI